MRLSNEQMAAICGPTNITWEEIELPTGRQQLPDWCKGAHVHWLEGLANNPELVLKVTGRISQWDKRWEKFGRDGHIARHEDGRADVLYHGGSVSTVKMKDQRRRADIRSGALDTFPEIEVQATTQQDGFAGSHYWLDMADGSVLVLRGPWHGLAPEGYVEVGAVDSTDLYFNRGTRKDRPWYTHFGCRLYITEDLFLHIVATHCAHVCVARVDHGYARTLEPIRAEWGVPKRVLYDIEHDRARNGEPAGSAWRTYWGTRTPTYGIQTRFPYKGEYQ